MSSNPIRLLAPLGFVLLLACSPSRGSGSPQSGDPPGKPDAQAADIKPAEPPPREEEGQAKDAPQGAPTMTDADKQFALYQGRLTSTSLTIAEGQPTLDPKPLGAIAARGFRVPEHQIELVMLLFSSQADHSGAIAKLKATDWSKDHQFDLAGAGPMLLLVRAPLSAGDKEDPIDALLGAFAGQE